MSTRVETNDKLEKYTDEHCSHLYAQVNKSGRIHLDGYFELVHIINIMKILEGITTH